MKNRIFKLKRQAVYISVKIIQNNKQEHFLLMRKEFFKHAEKETYTSIYEINT